MGEQAALELESQPTIEEALRAEIETLKEENRRLELPLGPMIAALLKDAFVYDPTIDQWLKACNLYEQSHGGGGSWSDLVAIIEKECDGRFLNADKKKRRGRS